MSFNITGTLVKRGNTETKGESFKVRTFAIKVEDGSQYENFAGFQLTQDRCGLVDGLNQGDEIKVHFDVRGRLWGEGDDQKVFTNLNAWKVEKLDAASEAPAPTPAAKEPVAEAAYSSGDDESLPF